MNKKPGPPTGARHRGRLRGKSVEQVPGGRNLNPLELSQGLRLTKEDRDQGKLQLDFLVHLTWPSPAAGAQCTVQTVRYKTWFGSVLVPVVWAATVDSKCPTQELAIPTYLVKSARVLHNHISRLQAILRAFHLDPRRQGWIAFGLPQPDKKSRCHSFSPCAYVSCRTSC
jgi:hypothetical protein